MTSDGGTYVDAAAEWLIGAATLRIRAEALLKQAEAERWPQDAYRRAAGDLLLTVPVPGGDAGDRAAGRAARDRHAADGDGAAQAEKAGETA